MLGTRFEGLEAATGHPKKLPKLPMSGQGFFSRLIRGLLKASYFFDVGALKNSLHLFQGEVPIVVNAIYFRLIYRGFEYMYNDRLGAHFPFPGRFEFI